MRGSNASVLLCEVASVDIYYAARSGARLDTVCEALRGTFGLPPFVCDRHDTWRDAWSEGEGLRLNVTQADDARTVETWMPRCPPGVNYQVILSAAREPPDFTGRLAEILRSEVVRYAASGQAADA